MKKRILPVLLALCMVMSLLPVAFATVDDPLEGCLDGCSGTAAEPVHAVGCPNKCDKCTKTAGHTDAHAGTACTNDNLCPASTHTGNCPKRCTCISSTHDAETDDRCTGTAGEGGLCTTCAQNATCNPCGINGCTGVKGHASKHTYDGCAGKDNIAKGTCPAAAGAHKVGCPDYVACDVNGCTLCQGHSGKHNYTGCANDDSITQGTCPGAAGTHGEDCPDYTPCDAGKVEAAEGVEAVEGCTLDRGHEGLHNCAGCTNDNKCSAATHKDTCPNKTAATCGKGGCTLVKGHPGDHNNEKCLGYNDDGKCGVDAGEHIAGCSEYVCECLNGHSAAGITLTNTKCTHKAGCPHCNEWNAKVAARNAAVAKYNKYLEDKAAWDAADQATRGPAPTVVENPGVELTACDCPDCRPNPAMGAVVDAEGNEVDPADPTEPTEPEIPTKAEDFTDMEDWMAADVQVALDKGWMQGIGDGKFDGRAATTGTMVAAVLARMDGEEITGTDWDKDALAWAEDRDVFEGIELTGETMARKDLVLVIWRMADKPESDFELTFTDVDGLEGDHLTAMKWAAENGIVKGNGDDTVTPDGAVNRAALCAMLARYDGLEK